MKRREFLIRSGLAGMALPGISWAAARPCPPPALSASGGTSASTACVAGGLPALVLRGGGANKPWTFGQVFRKGDVPDYLTATGAIAFQADIRNRWDDGSVKFAVLSGIGGTSVQLAASTSAPTGPELMQGAMVEALPSSSSVTVGTQTVSLNTLLNSSPQRAVSTGPVMSNWLFRQSLSVGTDMSLWVDVRYYSNGQIELFPWVENAYIQTRAWSNYYASTVKVTIGGTDKFSQAIDFKAKTRIPLINGSSFAYWTGSDPQITPQHDGTYFKFTRLVPNYGYGTPSQATLDGLTQTYTPNSLGGVGSGMGAAGGEGSVIAPQQVHYIKTNGDIRAYHQLIALGLGAGSWPVHLTDMTTKEPIAFSDFSTTRIEIGFGISGGTNGSPTMTHYPGFSYLPYLVTGRWFFLDETLHWASFGHLEQPTASRFGADSIFDPRRAGAYRRAAWELNTLAQALSILPENHALRSNYIHAWESNCRWYRTIFVDGGTYSGTNYGTAWVSPQFIFGVSGGVSPSGAVPGVYYESVWQNSYFGCVFGAAYDLELPISASSKPDEIAVRNAAYQFSIQRAGVGTNYNYRRFIIYQYPVGTDSAGSPPENWYTADQSYPVHCQTHGLDANLPGTAGSTLKNHSSDGDFAAGSSSLPYFSSGVMGLVYAKDHGVTGGSQAYENISGASNFLSGIGQYFADETPSYGVVPR